MNRRYSSVNGAAGGGVGGTAAPGGGRYSLAGRPSLASGKAARGGSQQQQVVGELAGLNIGASQLSQGSQRQSMVPRPSLERTSLSRRSSVYGKQSLTGGAPSIGKDPRPIRDKTFQAGCTRTLLEFLMQVGYPHPISQKILTAPSAKDFQQIFRFLYSHLDPTYEFGRKFEEEVPGLMKGLRYPFANEISKSQLYAVGSMHAWPSLLAMLCWMVELVQCCDELNNSNSSQRMDMDADMDTEVSGGGEKIFFDYLCKTYKVFLAGSDNFDAMIGELGDSFDRKNSAALSEASDLSRSLDMLSSELTALQKEEAPLAKAQKELSIYVGDVEKFKKFIGHLTVKKQKFFESIDRLEEDLTIVEGELADAEHVRTGLQAQVEAQDVCPEDIDRMNADKDQLVRSLESLTAARDAASKLFWDRELQVQKRLDAVDRLVHEYNHACERLSSHNGSINGLELSFNPHASRIDGLLSVDMKQTVLPLLSAQREECHGQTHQAQDRLLQAQETLDRISESLADKEEAVARLEERIKRTVQSYLADKESFQAENRQTADEADDLESTIHRLRSDTSSTLLTSQQRLQRSTIDYDQLVSRISEEKERVGGQIFGVLEELINFKTGVEGTLSGLESAYSRESS